MENNHLQALDAVVQLLKATPPKLLDMLDRGEACLLMSREWYDELGLSPGQSVLHRGRTIPFDGHERTVIVSQQSK